MPTWFLPDEAKWMMKYLPAYATFNRAQRVVYKGERVGAMKAFIGQVLDEFAERFPYRHPDTPLSRIPANLQRYQCSHEEWGELHDKFRHRFDYVKTRNANNLEADVNWESEGELENVGSDEWDSENENEETTSGSPTTRENTKEVGTDSAAENESKEEYRSGEGEKMSIVSVGGLMPECPGPVVYGDLDRDNHPLMPKDLLAKIERKRLYIFDYQCHKLRWQGGGMEVPYDQIKTDADEGRYQIVKADNVPPDVTFVKNPFMMPAEHVDPWFSYLIQCDTAQLPEDWQFQFARPDPDGVEVDRYQAVRSPRVRMEYGPEAHSYALFVQGIETANPEARDDGLPLYYADDVVFHSVSANQGAFWQDRLVGDEGYMGLLDALQRNDDAHPFQ
ncbi:hypothetical protein V565_306010, partial [Rhizoctonia solani 123E]